MTEDLTGWHPDPTGRHEHRYFDGSSWTDHVSDAGNLSTDPVAGAAEVAKPAEPSRVDLPAITPEMLAASAAAPAPAAAEPVPAAAAPTAAEPAPAAVARSDDDAFDSQAAAAALQMPAERPAIIAALLSVVFPGTGHLYLGAKREVGVGLIVATIVAAYFAYDPIGPWLLGLGIWLLAVLYALYDLRPSIEPALQAHGGRLNALAEVGSAWAWRLVGAGGIVLIVALLLPWYHASTEAFGESVSVSRSGFESLELIDIIGLAVGVLALVAAAVSLGVLSGKSLPAVLPTVLAVAGAAAWVLVEFRLFIPGGGGGLVTDLGRGPGLLLASAAAFTIAFGAASALAAGRRTAG